MTDRHGEGWARRRFLSAGGALVSGGCLAGVTGPGSNDDSSVQGPTVALTRVAAGFDAPVGFAAPPDGDAPVVVDQTGTAHRVTDAGREAEPFLDVTDRMVDVSGYSEQGLLGLAFHPAYGENRKLYVRYSAPRRAGTPSNFSHTFVLAEFEATSDGSRVRADSERTVLEVPQPQSNHNAGAVAFGPDDYLYVAVGDGGAGGDQGTGHVADWYDGVGGGNGQDVTENLLGSILRIDVDGRDGDRAYAVPADNPLVGRAGLSEQYAWGFRNPWRFSFDDGTLLAADVGQNAYEEVNVVEKGGNYGWNVREGRECFGADTCPEETPDGDPLVDPVVAYPHSGNDGVNGVAVVGGYVVHDRRIPALDGAYVFGDWRSPGAGGGSGAIFVARQRDAGTWPVQVVSVANREGGRVGASVLSFGRDRGGRAYVLTGDGVVSRLDPAADATAATPDGATTDGTETATADGSEDASETDPGAGSTPGFGVAAGAAGLAGGALALWRRRRRGD
jgi:glucose/arabinose dehydrogenase